MPGGLLIAIAVSMAPLAVLGVQTELGAWGEFGNPGTIHDLYEWVKGSFIFMEIATVIAGVVALHFYRFPFIVAIIAAALWFMSMDLAPWIVGTNEIDGEMRRKVSVWFGLAMLAVAWDVDYRSRSSDFAFWLHLFGLMAFWGGITATEGAAEIGKAIYCVFNVGLLFVAVIIMRRVYAVFGAFGISLYLGQSRRCRVQGLAVVSLRAVADRRRRRHERACLSSQGGSDCRLVFRELAAGRVAIAARCYAR